MSIKSAIELCQLKVSTAISASSKDDLLSAMREAEFALTVLAEAAESIENEDKKGRNRYYSPYLPPISSIEDAPWPEGDSDDNPEAETPADKRNREEMKNRGFFG